MLVKKRREFRKKYGIKIPAKVNVPNLVVKSPINFQTGYIYSAFGLTAFSISTLFIEPLNPISGYSFLTTAIVPQLLMAGYIIGTVVDEIQLARTEQIDMKEDIGYKISHFKAPIMSKEERLHDIEALVTSLSLNYVPRGNISRDELATRANNALTKYIQKQTGQEVIVSDKINKAPKLMKMFYPFAVGGCDMGGSLIYIFRDLGMMEPHILGHELTHRRGYIPEIIAQYITYNAFMDSGDPLLIQSSLMERLFSHYEVISNGNQQVRNSMIESSGLPEEMKEVMYKRRIEPSGLGKISFALSKAMYWLFLKASGQNGFSDYDRGFTDLLFVKNINVPASY